MSPLLRALLRGSTVQPWSVLFASAVAGDTVTVGAGVSVLYDLPTSPIYACVEIYGTLIVDRTKDTSLSFGCCEIFDGGRYFIGDAFNPFPRTFTHTITPSAARSIDPQVGSPIGPAISDSNRGVMVMDGGELAWHAVVPTDTNFRLGADAAIGATSITADRNVTLKAGDVLEISTTKYFTEGLNNVQYDYGIAARPGGIRRPGYGREMIVVGADVTNSTTIPIGSVRVPPANGSGSYTTQSTLAFAHCGRLQYVVAPAHEDVAGTGLSYTNTAILAADSFGSVNGVSITGVDVKATIAAYSTPTTVDHRADVCLMTHPIKFGAPNDTDWTTSGYGAHLMVMGLASKMQIQGVEMYRVGQAGFLGRYPIHEHMRSYTAYTGTVTSPVSGTYLGDVDPTYNYAKQSSILGSSNRARTIHGTCGGVTYQLAMADIDTHAVFLEDGSEQRNVIDGNVVSGVGAIRYGATAIKRHDNVYFGQQGASAPYANGGGPAGIWYTNPNNYLRNNSFGGGHTGIWNAFSHPYYTCYMERGTHTSGSIAFGYSGHAITVSTFEPTETITLTATSSTNLTRVGSVTGAMSAVTTGITAYHGASNNWSYTVTGPVTVGQTFVFTAKFFNGCFGASRDVAASAFPVSTFAPGGVAAPGYIENPLEFDNNRAFSASRVCMMSTPFNTTEEGDTRDVSHDAIGQRFPFGITTSETLFTISRMNLFKGAAFNYFNESDHPLYDRWQVYGGRGDANYPPGTGEMIQGNVNATSSGGRPAEFRGCAMGVRTLDDYYGVGANHEPANIMVSYGGGINRVGCLFWPEQATTLTLGGGGFNRVIENGSTMQLHDFYLYPINRHFTRDLDTLVLGADPGYFGVRFPPTEMAYNNAFGASYQTIVAGLTLPWAQGNSGAFALPVNGMPFKRAGGGWWVHDSPFLTYGTTSPVTAKSNVNFSGMNGKLLDNTHTYIGLQGVSVNGVDIVTGDQSTSKPINFTRYQADGVTAVTGGTWNFGPPATAYANMRHAALLAANTGGTPVKMSWSLSDIAGGVLPTSMVFNVFGMLNAADHVIVIVQFNHTSVGTVTITDNAGANGITFSSVASLALLLAATSCKYWIDTANDLLYLNIFGGTIANPYASDTYNTDRKWLKQQTVTIT